MLVLLFVLAYDHAAPAPRTPPPRSASAASPPPKSLRHHSAPRASYAAPHHRQNPRLRCSTNPPPPQNAQTSYSGAVDSFALTLISPSVVACPAFARGRMKAFHGCVCCWPARGGAAVSGTRLVSYRRGLRPLVGSELLTVHWEWAKWASSCPTKAWCSRATSGVRCVWTWGLSCGAGRAVVGGGRWRASRHGFISTSFSAVSYVCRTMS